MEATRKFFEMKTYEGIPTPSMKQQNKDNFGQNVEDSNENDEPTSGSDYSQDSFEDFADLFGNDGADVDSNEDHSHIKVQYVPF